MNDFDFEELDKAVNSLAARTQVEHGGGDEPSLPAVMMPSAVATASHSQPATATMQLNKPAAVSVVPKAVPQNKSARLADVQPPRGRRAFMDIVPPEARKPVPSNNRAVKPIGELENVIPGEANEKDGLKPGTSVMLSPDLATSKPASQPWQQTESASAQGEPLWPDPLDFTKLDSPKTLQPSAVSGSGHVPLDTPRRNQDHALSPQVDSGLNPVDSDRKEGPWADFMETKQSVVPEPGTASSTPFLPAAKVEKRPLGAYSDFKPRVEPEPSPELSQPHEALGAEGLANEHTGTYHAPEVTQPALVPRADTQAETSAQNDMHSTAMMSIPQQYRVEDRTADNTARPVYDTKEYHPPLLEAVAHSHRGGSMWIKLFLALVALVALAVGGYFLGKYMGL
jgi:hypothetical protein